MNGGVKPAMHPDFNQYVKIVQLFETDCVSISMALNIYLSGTYKYSI